MNNKSDRKKRLMYDKIQSIDFDQDWDNTRSHFDIQQTFTWTDWVQADMLFDRKNSVSFDSLFQEEKVRLCVSLFHHGDSLLKMISTRLS